MGDTFQASSYIVHHQGGHIHSRILSQIAYAHQRKVRLSAPLSLLQTFSLAGLETGVKASPAAAARDSAGSSVTLSAFLLTG